MDRCIWPCVEIVTLVSMTQENTTQKFYVDARFFCFNCVIWLCWLEFIRRRSRSASSRSENKSLACKPSKTYIHRRNRERERKNLHLRAFKTTFSPRFLTLVTLWRIRLTFNFLFSARNTGLRQPFPRLARLGQTPVWINWLTVNEFRTVRIISEDVANTLPRKVPFINDLIRCRGSSRGWSFLLWTTTTTCMLWAWYKMEKRRVRMSWTGCGIPWSWMASWRILVGHEMWAWSVCLTFAWGLHAYLRNWRQSGWGLSSAIILVGSITGWRHRCMVRVTTLRLGWRRGVMWSVRARWHGGRALTAQSVLRRGTRQRG